MSKVRAGLVIAMLAIAPVASAQKSDVKRLAADEYDVLFKTYLDEARTQATPSATDAGSWINSLMGDTRARRVNDLITVQVVENISAAGSADAATSKSGAATAGVPNLFGVENKLPSFLNPANLVGAKHDTTFKGAGTATRGARVAEVLPNGDLVVEGVREIQINGDRQLVVLTGVVRVADIAPGNVVLSTTIGQLRIRYFGRGLMKDSLTPGWLIRVLNKIFCVGEMVKRAAVVVVLVVLATQA